MPGTFFSSSGCLFSFLAWAGVFMGIASALVSSLVYAVTKRLQRFVTVVPVFLGILVVAAVLLLIGNYSYLADVRAVLHHDPRISTSPEAVFQYLPPDITVDPYYQKGFPTIPEVNASVLTLRLGTGFMLAALVGAVVILVRRRHTASRLLWPLLVLGAGSLLTIGVDLVNVVI